MGEVWQGRDTRLDRSVAVKILPAAIAQDEEFRARFEREAKTISSLNHPNVCTLFDVGREGETQFLVMELLEGESLADRLQRGPLPLDQVVKFGAQVADALDAAHRQGRAPGPQAGQRHAAPHRGEAARLRLGAPGGRPRRSVRVDRASDRGEAVAARGERVSA
jgi:serine/threonine protein kinase